MCRVGSQDGDALVILLPLMVQKIWGTVKLVMGRGAYHGKASVSLSFHWAIENKP